MKSGNQNQLDRDHVILARLARLEHKVDSIDQTTAFALRADLQRHVDSVRAIFRNGMRRAQVYLAANGQRTVQAIAAHLGMQVSNVSRELAALQSDGLLEVVETIGSANVWGKKAIDRTLKISSFLRKEYGLAADGKSSSARPRSGRSPK